VHRHRGAQRYAGDVRPLDGEGIEQVGQPAGVVLGGGPALGDRAFARARQIDGDAPEALGVDGKLECPAGVVGRQARDEQRGSPSPATS
jgi:hypothetical protein